MLWYPVSALADRHNSLDRSHWQNFSSLSGFNPAWLSLNPPENSFYHLGGNLLVADNFLSLSQLIGDWHGSFTPQARNYILHTAEVESGICFKKWDLSLIWRREIYLKANDDFIEFMKKVQTKNLHPSSRVYQLEFNGHGFSAYGLRCSYAQKLSSIPVYRSALGIAMTLWQGQEIQDAQLRGEGKVINTKDYDFNGHLSYDYHDNYLYDRPDSRVNSGQGFSLDLGLGVDFSRNLGLSILARDLLGWIWWKDVSYSEVYFNSDNKVYDESGYVTYNPTISGEESYHDLRQKIKPKINLGLYWKLKPFQINSVIDWVDDQCFMQSYLDWHFHSLKYTIGYGFALKQITLRLNYRDILSLSFSFDHHELEKARWLEASIKFIFW